MVTTIMNLQVGNVLGQAPVFQSTPPPPELLLVYIDFWKGPEPLELDHGLILVNMLEHKKTV